MSKKDWTTEELQIKQQERMLDSGVKVETFQENPNYFYVNELDNDTIFMYVPRTDTIYDKEERTITFKEFEEYPKKIWHVITLSNKFNNGDILWPIYYKSEYDFFNKKGYKEITNDNLFDIEGFEKVPKYFIGKNFKRGENRFKKSDI